MFSLITLNICSSSIKGMHIINQLLIKLKLNLLQGDLTEPFAESQGVASSFLPPYRHNTEADEE